MEKIQKHLTCDCGAEETISIEFEPQPIPGEFPRDLSENEKNEIIRGIQESNNQLADDMMREEIARKKWCKKETRDGKPYWLCPNCFRYPRKKVLEAGQEKEIRRIAGRDYYDFNPEKASEAQILYAVNFQRYLVIAEKQFAFKIEGLDNSHIRSIIECLSSLKK